MLASTFLAIFFVPLFFVVVLRRFGVKPGLPGPNGASSQASGASN